MNNDDLTNLIKNKYPRFFGEYYENMDEFLSDIKPPYKIAEQWEEFGITLALLFDNNMWECIVGIKK